MVSNLKVMAQTRKFGRMDARTNAETPNSHCGDYVEPYNNSLA